MIYICAWIVNYLLLLFSELTNRKRLAAVLSVLALGAVVILRGNVGVDDMSGYESLAIRMSMGFDIEPLFVGLMALLGSVFPTPQLAVTMGLGSVYVLLLLVYVSRADDRELFIMQAFYIPAMFWTSALSGQRGGLAITLLLLALQSVRLKQNKSAVILSVAAIFTHYSAVLFIAFWGAMVLKVSRKTYFRFGGLLVLLSAVLIAFARTHFDEKFIIYLGSGYTAPSRLSGLATVFVTGLLLMAVVIGSIEKEAKVRIITISLLGLAAFVLITRYSYGGLRLLPIVETAVLYAALSLYAGSARRFKAHFKSMVLIAGLAGAILMYRDMLNEDRVLTTPGRSLPYTFFWQEGC